eukprot:COSAG02_NODE_2434_length_8868_cov_96.980388_6_plen_47_part_00
MILETHPPRASLASLILWVDWFEDLLLLTDGDARIILDSIDQYIYR